MDQQVREQRTLLAGGDDDRFVVAPYLNRTEHAIVHVALARSDQNPSWALMRIPTYREPATVGGRPTLTPPAVAAHRKDWEDGEGKSRTAGTAIFRCRRLSRPDSADLEKIRRSGDLRRAEFGDSRWGCASPE